MKTKCIINGISGYDLYGQPMQAEPRNAKCAIVKISMERRQVTLRSDTGAEKGHGEEIIADAIFLMNPKDNVVVDDVVTVDGHDFRVMRAIPRYRVTGKLDHLQIEATVCR